MCNNLNYSAQISFNQYFMFSFCEFHKKDQLSFAKGGTSTILEIEYNAISTLKDNDIYRLLQETSLFW